jgi:hypothetical protein
MLGAKKLINVGDCRRQADRSHFFAPIKITRGTAGIRRMRILWKKFGCPQRESNTNFVSPVDVADGQPGAMELR